MIITNNPQLTRVLNNAKISEIYSLNPKGDRTRSGLKRLDLIADIHFLRLQEEKNVDYTIDELQKRNLLEYVEAHRTGTASGTNATPDDPELHRQWGLVNNGTLTGSVANADVTMDQAWEIKTGNSNTVLCILDTVLKLDHPEFAGRLWMNADENSGNGIHDDGNDCIDDHEFTSSRLCEGHVYKVFYHLVLHSRPLLLDRHTWAHAIHHGFL